MSQTTNANSAQPNPTNSAKTIGYSKDILSKILLHVPVKYLISCKRVSKLWCREISSRYFVLRYNPLHPPLISGLLLVPKNLDAEEQIEYISQGQIELNSPVFPLSKLSNMKLLQSCNGLMLYSEGEEHYVLNPTTQEKKLLPRCPDTISPTNPLFYNLVFDPSVSLHYKIISLAKTTQKNKYRILIYSSESELWNSSKASEFSAPDDIDFTSGIYCNGSVHWTKRTKAGLYYDVEKDTLNHMPEKPRQEQYICEYFGHSRGHLYCVFTMQGLHYYELFEMKKDYSAWVLKSKIELNALASQYPKMASQNPLFTYQCHVLSVFRRDNGEGVEMIMSIPGEVIAYDCEKKTSRQISQLRHSDKEKKIWYNIYQAYEYFESISPVSFLTT